MGLCGGYRCGCGLTSTPATTGEINGELPTINVTGSGEPGDPYDIGFSDAWAFWVAEGIKRPRVGYRWDRRFFQSIPSGVGTIINADTNVDSGPPGADWTPGVTVTTVPAGLGGVYLISGTVVYQNPQTNTHRIHIRINGGARFFVFAGAGPSVNHQAATAVTTLSPGDVVELETLQTSGSAQNATARFEIYRLPDDNPFYSGP